jgi:hypothetical protein
VVRVLICASLFLFLPGCERIESESGTDLEALRLRLAVGEAFVFSRPVPGTGPVEPAPPLTPGDRCSGALRINRELPAPLLRAKRSRLFPLFKRRKK